MSAPAGLEPPPGDPDELRRLGRAAGRAAVQLTGSAARMRSIAATDGVWRGDAAEACRARLGALPARLDDAAAALRHAAGAVLACASHLEQAQHTARRLSAEALELLAAPPSFESRLQLDEVHRRARAARAELDGHLAVAARALRAAAESAPDEPGWWERAAGAVDDRVRAFVVEHARAVELAAYALGLAAGLAAATGLGAAVAVPLAAASYAASLALVHYTEADEDDLLLATAGVLTLGTGMAAGRAVQGAVAAGAPSSAALAAAVGRTAERADAALTVVGGALTGRGVVDDLRTWRRRRERERAVR